jgi:hypothetical protein
VPLRFFTSWREPSPKYRSRGLVKRPMVPPDVSPRSQRRGNQ